MSPFDYSGPSRVLTPAMRRKKPGPKSVVLASNYGHHFCPEISPPSSRDTTAKIQGRRNESRTQ